MKYSYYDLGQQQEDRWAVVRMRGSAANVILLDPPDRATTSVPDEADLAPGRATTSVPDDADLAERETTSVPLQTC